MMSRQGRSGWIWIGLMSLLLIGQAQQVRWLGHSSGRAVYAYAVSADGQVVVGSLPACWLDTRVAGDVDGDGCVDGADLLAVLFAFGNSGSGLSEDVNEDGVVDDADLLIVLFNFGSGC